MSEQAENPERDEEDKERRRRHAEREERMMDNLLSAAMIDLQPLIDATATDLDLTLGQVVKLTEYMGEAWVAGARSGQAEALAQAIEAGSDVEVTGSFPDLPSDPHVN